MLSQEIKAFIDTFLSAIPYPVYYRGSDGSYAGCNKPFEKFADITMPELVKTQGEGLWPPEFHELNRDEDLKLIREAGTYRAEMTVSTRRGPEQRLMIMKMSITSTGGLPEGVVCALIDITGQKKTERRLRQLSMAVEQSPATVVITDHKGTIEYVNPKFTSLTGYSFDEAMGQNPRILKSGHQGDEFYREMWQTISSGREWRGEFHNRKRNGDLYWEHASISPVRDDDGRITHYVAVKEDVTARKTAEEEREAALQALRKSEEALRERNKVMERDLKLAQIAHRALLESELPSAPFLETGFRHMPMERVGGDYYSFTRFRENVMGVFVGDVSGHGVASALFLSLLRYTTERMGRKYGRTPGEYMAKLNDSLHGNMSSYFLTGIYAVIEHTPGESSVIIRLANGGHPYPVMVGRDSARFMGPRDTVIGAFGTVSYREEEYRLYPGDMLFMYTDGIPECENPGREQLGYEQPLLDIFEGARRPTLPETLDAVMKQVIRFRNGAPQSDDVLLIGFKVKES